MHASSPCGCRKPTSFAVPRSALFPLPTAFEGTGLVAALVIMAVVAMVTVYACELLMDQCTVTGQHDYEMLSYAVGGIWWQARPTRWLT